MVLGGENLIGSQDESTCDIFKTESKPVKKRFGEDYEKQLSQTIETTQELFWNDIQKDTPNPTGEGNTIRRRGGSRRKEEVVVFLKDFGELEADVFRLFFLEKHELGARRLVPRSSTCSMFLRLN